MFWEDGSASRISSSAIPGIEAAVCRETRKRTAQTQKTLIVFTEVL